MWNKQVIFLGKEIFKRERYFLKDQRRILYSATALQSLKQVDNVCIVKDVAFNWGTTSGDHHIPVRFNPFIPKCMIFDKDGTLVCFHKMWNPWCISLAQRMSSYSGLDGMDKQVYRILGYDSEQEKVKIGPLAENTARQIKEKLEEMLREENGFNSHDAKELVKRTWKDTPDDMRIELIGDVHSLFSHLKRHGIKIAICTSDSQEGTNEFLWKKDLHSYIDMLVCGDDDYSKPKPDPHNALYICEKLGVKPSDTVMVGDTPADTLMGQRANLGLTVGVLSGVGDRKDLANADVIVPSINECINMIIPPASVTDMSQTSTHYITSKGYEKVFLGSQIFYKPSNQKTNVGKGEQVTKNAESKAPPSFFDSSYIYDRSSF